MNKTASWVVVNGAFLYLIWNTMWHDAVLFCAVIMALSGLFMLSDKWVLKREKVVNDLGVPIWLDVLYDVGVVCLAAYVGWHEIAVVYTHYVMLEVYGHQRAHVLRKSFNDEG